MKNAAKGINAVTPIRKVSRTRIKNLLFSKSSVLNAKVVRKTTPANLVTIRREANNPVSRAFHMDGLVICQNHIRSVDNNNTINNGSLIAQVKMFRINGDRSKNVAPKIAGKTLPEVLNIIHPTMSIVKNINRVLR